MAETFNLFEAILWFLMALFLSGWALSGKAAIGQKKVVLLLSGILVLFGISDLIEMRTGAWWQPVSLLVLKAVCVLGIVFCLIWLSRRSREGRRTSRGS